MCLFIDTYNHEEQPARYIPKVATRPLVVWKVLREQNTCSSARSLNGNRWVSPVRDFPYVFEKLYTSEMVFDGSTIEDGLHALRAPNQYEANDIWGLDPVNFPFKQAFPALIPVGSEFFVGEDDDVVTNQLIVFRTLDDLMNYCGVTKLAPPVESSQF